MAELRAYRPSWRDQLAQWMLGDQRPTAGQRAFVSGLLGSAGTGPTGASVADMTPLGGLLSGQEAAQHGDYKTAALAALPMPAGKAKALARAPYARKLSPQGLYSWGAEAAHNLPQETMTVQQARSMLERAGTKPDEFKWSGFETAFPDLNAKVSRDALVKHFESNVPQLGETVLGHDPRIDALTAQIDQMHDEAAASPFIVRNRRSGFTSPSFPTREAAQEYVAGMPESMRGMLDIRREPNPMSEARFDRLTAQRRGLLEDAQPPEYEKYTLDGGDNYREVLTTLPNFGNDAARRMTEIEGLLESPVSDAEYRRLSLEYKDLAPEAAKSDQYMSSHWVEPNVLAHARMSDRVDMEGNKVLHLEESQSDWGQEARKKGFKDTSAADALQSQIDSLKRASAMAPAGSPEEDAAMRQIFALREDQSNARNGVPEAPYVGSTGNKSATGWTDLNLKRALWEAANSGADRLAWTPGAEQAARYPGLPDAGKGLTAYYDSTIPTQIGAVLKRAGVSGGDIGKAFVELPYSNSRASFAELPALTLTPEMREQIKRGLPYFSLGPLAFGGLLGAQQQNDAGPLL